MRKNGFTLIEIIAVIVILGIILAIAVPSITGVISNSSKTAFESDAKLVLKAIDYEKMSNTSFNPTIVDEDNISNLLGLSSSNYSSIKIANEDDTLILTIVGKGKWDGLVACGTYQNMSVYISTTNCSTDLIPPVITLVGDNPTDIFINNAYADAGATAIDDKDGDITDKIFVASDINPNIPGSYNITYSVTDSVGNTRTMKRIVNVIDNVGPDIALSMNGNSTYAKGRITTISVTDAGGIDISSLRYLWSTSVTEPSSDLFTLSYTNNQSVSTPSVSGGYYLWLKGADLAGNETVMKSNVFNLDNVAPTISLNGNSSVTVNKGSIYTDAGATATDNIDTSITVMSTGSVNPNTVGSYTITYNATDSSENTAASVSRTITVVDVAAPVITILGSNPKSIEYGSVYADAGATATDDVDGNVTSKITTTSTVNPNVLGSYTVTYRVSDTAGNTATLIRTVNVVDTTPPTAPTISGGSTTYATSRTITVTAPVEVASGINRYEYYLSSTSTAPTIGTVGTSNGLTLTKVFNTNMAGYYVYFRAVDNAGNVGTWSAVQMLYIDINYPTITANAGSYTITQGASNALPGTYFTINQNGNATISTTTCVDTSNGNTSVTNTNTLAVGTHVIRCTTIKTTGLSTNTTTNIVVNPAYTCATGTLTNDASKGYICTVSASTQGWYTTSYQCTSCNSCTYTYPNYVYGGQSCTYCGGGQTVINQIGLGNQFFSDTNVASGSRPNFGDVYTGQSWTECSSCSSGCNGKAYACWYGNVNTTVTPCNTCDYVQQITTTGSNCSYCGCSSGYNVYNYYCNTGWTTYSGSGSSLTCYKAATQQ